MAYARQVLDALRIENGPGHMEVGGGASTAGNVRRGPGIQAASFCPEAFLEKGSRSLTRLVEEEHGIDGRSAS